MYYRDSGCRSLFSHDLLRYRLEMRSRRLAVMLPAMMYSRFKVLLAGSVFGLVLMSGAWAQSSPVADSGDLRSMIADIAFDAPLERTCVARVFTLPTDWNWGESTAAKRELIRVIRWDFRQSGLSLQFVRQSIDEPEKLKKFSAIGDAAFGEAPAFHFVWRPGKSVRWMESDAAIAINTDLAHPDVFGYGLFLTASLERFSQFSAKPPSIAAELKGAKLIRFDRQADRWEFEFEPANTQRLRLGYVIRLADDQKLAMLERRWLKMRSESSTDWSDQNLDVMQELEVTEWQADDSEGGVPRTARLLSRGRSADGNWSCYVVEYTLEALRDSAQLDRDLAYLDGPYEAGLGVVDERTGISFTVGESALLLDGVIYKTKDPITHVPEDSLADLLANAESTIRAEDAVRGAQVKRGRALWMLVGAGLLFAGIAFGGTYWFFRRRQSGVVMAKGGGQE